MDTHKVTILTTTMLTNRDLLSRLKFIGRIQPSEKVSLPDMSVCNDNIITTIWRSLFRDNSRQKTLSFVQDTIDKSFEIIHNYIRSDKKSDIMMIEFIVEDIKSSKQGLVNLKETYSMDRKFCCDIDLLLLTIDARLTELDFVKL
jgi:hypothetical protein